MYILEWLEPWEGGPGEKFVHRVFQSEKRAVEAGQTLLRARLAAKGEPLYYVERMLRAFAERNSEGNHYALSLFIKPVDLE